MRRDNLEKKRRHWPMAPRKSCMRRWAILESWDLDRPGCSARNNSRTSRRIGGRHRISMGENRSGSARPTPERDSRQPAFLQSAEAKAPQTSATTGTPSPGGPGDVLPSVTAEESGRAGQIPEEGLGEEETGPLMVPQMMQYQLIRRTCRWHYDRENMRYKVCGLGWVEDTPR